MSGIDGSGGISGSLFLGAGVLRVHAVGMQVGAHNIANVSTDGFEPQRAVYATGPRGWGVDLQTVEKAGLDGRAGAASQPLANGKGAEIANASGTELAREIPNLIMTQRGFEANAATVRTADEMLGTLLDISA